jgi:hypothetical protein
MNNPSRNIKRIAMMSVVAKISEGAHPQLRRSPRTRSERMQSGIRWKASGTFSVLPRSRMEVTGYTADNQVMTWMLFILDPVWLGTSDEDDLIGH